MLLGLCLGAASSGAEEHGCLGEALKIWQSVQDNGFSSVVAMYSSSPSIEVPGRRVSVLEKGSARKQQKVSRLTTHTFPPQISGSVVQWFSGSVVQWFSGSVDQWFSGSVVQWFSGSVDQLVDQWFSGSVDQWFSGSVDQWFSGSISGSVDQWFSGSVDQLVSGSVVQWIN
jgi:hypothetical protein